MIYMAKKKTFLHPLCCSSDQPGPVSPFITALNNKSDLFRKLTGKETGSIPSSGRVSELYLSLLSRDVGWKNSGMWGEEGRAGFAGFQTD